MRKTLLVAIISAMLMGANSASALTVFDPTNYNANLETKLQAIKQVQQQAQQLQNEMANLKKLSSGDLSNNTDAVKKALENINKLRTESNAIGTDYAGLMKEWDELNPDYESWNGVSASKYAEQTKKLREATEKAIKQSMRTNTSASPEEQKKAMLNVEQMLDASQNADGAMGALQAGNQLVALQIAELQKMQMIMTDSMRSQNMYLQKELDKEAQATKINKESQHSEHYQFSDLQNKKPAHFEE